jgi:hypothetical protein
MLVCINACMVIYIHTYMYVMNMYVKNEKQYLKSEMYCNLIINYLNKIVIINF